MTAKELTNKYLITEVMDYDDIDTFDFKYKDTKAIECIRVYEDLYRLMNEFAKLKVEEFRQELLKNSIYQYVVDNETIKQTEIEF